MDTILEEQKAYYRERAAEYDEWFYRRGRYDHGTAENQRWFAEVASVRSALHALPRAARALELACGTGIWTAELLDIADHITALDASQEMLAINRQKVASERVRYQQADLFDWTPAETYDLVFFGFWLSHIPPERLGRFLATVRTALAEGGRFFLVDSRKSPSSTARDHHLPSDGHLLTRKLNDGREFTIVKIFYEPDALMASFADAGLRACIQQTPTFFIYGEGDKEK